MVAFHKTPDTLSRRSQMHEIFNGSYTAKIPPRTPGHNRPVIFSRQRSFKRRLRSETCLISYFRSSAFAAAG